MRRLVTAVLFMLAGLGCLPPARGEEPASDPTVLQKQAETLADQGRYRDAEPLLQRAVSLLESQFGRDDPRLAPALGLLGEVYEGESRYSEAEPPMKRALALRRKDPGPDRLNLGAALNRLAGLYSSLGRYAEAEDLFRQALDIDEAAPSAPVGTTATILTNLGLIYQNQGRFDEAEPLYRRAIAAVETSPEADRELGPVIRNNLAGVYKAQGQYDEAEQLYRRVLDAREKEGAAPLDLAASLNNLALIYDVQHRYGEAGPLLERALKLREDALGPDHPYVAQSLNNLAGIYWGEHQPDKAEPLLRRALAIKQRTLSPDHPETAAALNNLAAFYWSVGRGEEALDMSTRAVAAVEAHLAADAGRNSAATFAEYRRDRTYFANYVEIAHGMAEQHPERAAALAGDSFRVAQLAEATTTASAVAAMAARLAAGTDALAAAIRQQQDAAAQWRRLDGEVVALAARPRAVRDPTRVAALQASLAEAQDTSERLAAKIATEFPGYAGLAATRPIDAAAIEALLAPDEALLVYFTTTNHTWLWVVRDDGITLYRTGLGSRGLANTVEALRDSLTPDLPPYPAAAANALYDQVIAPALPRLTDAKRLIVVPDGALQSLPFSILVASKPDHDPATPEDYRGIDWLARHYAVSMLPAVSSLRALRQSAGAHQTARKPFLGIGDPVLAGAPGTERGAPADPGLRAVGPDVRKLPALPETADELKTIALTLGAGPDDLLLRGRASEPVLRSLPLDQYRVIEFATHGLLSGELKGLSEPALVLTPPDTPVPGNDGLLTASKIAGLKLDADWVVLSACNTAEGDAGDTGGWSGLAQAFFYAGARSLLISHWPVWSKATVALTSGTFDALRKAPEIGRAEALRRAEMAMLDPNQPAEFAHPLAWAPFVLAGEGGPGR